MKEWSVMLSETTRTSQDMCIQDSRLSVDSVEGGLWKTSWFWGRDSCDSGCVGLEAGVCGEVDNVHKHLIPPFVSKWLSVCFSQFIVEAPRAGLVKCWPMNPEDIYASCDLSGSENLLFCSSKTWNITFLPHVCLLSTSEPYDTLIVDTLKPGKEPR